MWGPYPEVLSRSVEAAEGPPATGCNTGVRVDQTLLPKDFLAEGDDHLAPLDGVSGAPLQHDDVALQEEPMEPVNDTLELKALLRLCVGRLGKPLDASPLALRIRYDSSVGGLSLCGGDVGHDSEDKLVTFVGF